MKKLGLILLILACLLLAFSSCGEEETESSSKAPQKPESAEELWDMAKEQMDALSSFKGSTEVSLKMFVDEAPINGKITGVVILVNHEKSPYYYEEIVNELKNTDLGIDQKTTSIEAYANGKRFLRYEDGELFNKICAEFDYSEFEEYVEKKTGGSELDPTECVNADFSENEDGTWTLTASGFPKKAIQGFVSDKFDGLGADIDDIELTLTISEDFLVMSEEFSFVFEDLGELTPSVSYVCEYTDFNSAKRITETINPDEYVKLDAKAFKLLDKIESCIEEQQNSEHGALNLTAYQEIKVQNGGKITTYETDTVEYGIKNGRFFYDITAVTDAKEIKIKYENGTLTQSNTPGSVALSDFEAKRNIASLIDSAQFNKALVLSAKENTNGTFTLEHKLNAEQYEAMIEAIAQGKSHRYDDAIQKLVITLTDGEVSQIKSTIEVRGAIASGKNVVEVVITVGSTVEFVDPSGLSK